MEKQTKKQTEVQGTKTEGRKASKLTMLRSVMTLEGHLNHEETTPNAVTESLNRIRQWLQGEILKELGL